MRAIVIVAATSVLALACADSTSSSDAKASVDAPRDGHVVDSAADQSRADQPTADRSLADQSLTDQPLADRSLADRSLVDQSPADQRAADSGHPCGFGAGTCPSGKVCCLTCCGQPPPGDAAVKTHSCLTPLDGGNRCPPPPP